MKRGLSMSIADAEAHQRKHGFMEGPLIAPQSPVAAPNKIRGSKEPNKTEQAFNAFMCVQRHRRMMFEGVKLRIAGNCYYTPDWFDGEPPDQLRPICFEVKGGGPIRDDSIVKFKAARELHPWFEFQMWRKTKDGWVRLF
jgi:hypothetical protein